LTDAHGRLIALAEVRPTEDFEPLAASCKRISNILKQAEYKVDASFNAELFEPGPERELHGRLMEFMTRNERSYAKRLAQIAQFRPYIDRYFDTVLVNAPDPKIRGNRLALLHELRTQFSTIADFSEIVTAGEQKS
jgi:glycyl-tRNA synthetase beta chain